MIDETDISPCYIIEESLLRRNLALIKSIGERAGVEIILAFKAFALWKAFPIFREYGFCSTASSVNEARLAVEEMGSLAHTYSPAYTDDNFKAFMTYSSHITFNSLSQFRRFYPQVEIYTETVRPAKSISCGLRINPQYSEVATQLYNPCAVGSRLGITADTLGDRLPDGVEGLHFHTLCESTAQDLDRTLTVVEKRFRPLLKQIKWLNMGGGHLMTRKDYDTEHLVTLLQAFRATYPHLHIILEPGSAFAWQTGYLRTTVVDIVECDGIQTAIIDASFACHAPDCLEMPYQPAIRNAAIVDPSAHGRFVYRIGGNSCLSGDVVGSWVFRQPLNVGDVLIMEDMMHYTTVKTTMFNGVAHPSIAIRHIDGTLEIYRTFTYDDYKNRMD